MKGWKTSYHIGTQEFSDKAKALAYAKEWAIDRDGPITITVERRRIDIGARGRLFGFSTQDLKYGKDIEVWPPKKRKANSGGRRRNVSVVRDELYACQDCSLAIANDDFTGMDDAQEKRTRAGINRLSKLGYLVLGDDQGYMNRGCDVCKDGLAGDKHEVRILGKNPRGRGQGCQRHGRTNCIPCRTKGRGVKIGFRRKTVRPKKNPARLPGEPDQAKLLAKALKPGNNIVTMARIQQQAHDWGFYDITHAVHLWMKEVGATQSEMERYWLKRAPERHRYRNPNSVRVQGFTGTITRRPDGTVQVKGQGKRA